MFTVDFWKAAAERAIRAAAAALIALWAGDGVFNALSIAWQDALGVGLGAGLLSVLFSIVGSTVNNTPGPSLLGTETTRHNALGTRRGNPGPNAPYTGGH